VLLVQPRKLLCEFVIVLIGHGLQQWMIAYAEPDGSASSLAFHCRK
jgi:hypothetical protein